MQKHDTKQMQALMPEDAINEAIRQLEKARQVIYVNNWERIQLGVLKAKAQEQQAKQAADHHDHSASRIVLSLIEMREKLDELLPGIGWSYGTGKLGNYKDDIADLHDLTIFLNRMMSNFDEPGNTGPEPTNAA